jgi:hypothetical protein
MSLGASSQVMPHCASFEAIAGSNTAANPSSFRVPSACSTRPGL